MIHQEAVLFRVLPLPAVVKRLNGGERNFHTSIVPFDGNRCFSSRQFDLKRTIERGPVSLAVRAMCENRQPPINFSLFINAPTHNTQEKHTLVSYCPARHDLLLPASLTWLALPVFSTTAALPLMP